jgi:hypothetical protein
MSKGKFDSIINENIIFLFCILVKGDELGKDKDMFDAYVSLRKIAQQYELEGKLAIPRVVFVGETSAGKSMSVNSEFE